MQNNIRKAFVAALLAVAAFGVSLAAPGGAAPGMPRPPWARPGGVATATSVKTTTARLGSLRRDDTVVVAVEGVVDGSGVDSNTVQGIVEEYCGTNIVPRVDVVESGLSDVEEWQRTNGLYSAVAKLGDSVSAALATKADGTVVERGVYSPAMDTNDVWVVDTDGTVLRFSDADPAAGTVTWCGVCASNTLWVSGSTTSAPPAVVYSLTTLEVGATRVLASVDVVDAATGARCGIPRSASGGTGDDVAYLAPSYDQAGPGDLQYSYTTTVRPLGSGALVFHRTDSGALAEVVRLSRGRVVDAETSVVYDADLRRRLAELRAAVVSRDAAVSGFTEWVVSAERPVTGEVVVAAFPVGSAPSGACDWSLFYADDAVRGDSTRLADVKRASSAATNLVWAASETSWGISVTACRVRVPTVADIEGVQAVVGRHYDDANAMFAKLLHYATNNYYSAYLANKRAKDLEAWQYTNAVGRADVERGMTDWAMTPMWPIGYVDAAQVLDGPDAGRWSLFPTGAVHTASNALLPAIDGAKNRFGDVVELLWPDASWRVEEGWTNSLDKLGFRWTPDPGDGYVTAHFDARATRTRVVTMEDVYSLSTNMAQTVTGLVGGVSERLDRLGAGLASAARLSLPGGCFPVTYMAGSSPPVTIGGADGLSFREDGGVVRMGDAASGRYICSFDPGTLRFLESPYGDALLFGRGYSPGASNEWPVLSVAACGASVVPAGRTVNGKALTHDVTLTGADMAVSGTDATKISDALADKVSVSRMVNGKALSSDVTLTANDIDYSVPGGAQSVQMTLEGIDVALAGKASKADLDPLLFAQYYPDGSVKSVAEFTPGIKYDAPNTVNRTITVRPFCNTGPAANDNSGLVGRVVIPPFVDSDGNGYISDDGTRFKVVGVSGSDVVLDDNRNLTALIAPSTVTTIRNAAFRGCSSLTSVSLPAATSIGDRAFLTCPSIASVDFGDTPRSSVPTLGEFAFANVPTSCKIIVPYTQYDAWKAADGWRDLPQEFVRHAEKADKPATFTTGNLAKFDNAGNPTDSGKSFEDIQSQIDTESPLLARSFAVQRQSGWREASGATGTAGNSVIFFRPRYFGMKDGDLFKGIVLQTRADQRTVFSNGVYMRLRAVPADQSAPWPTLGVSDLTVWPDTPKTDVVFRLPRAVSLPSSGSYYALDFVLDPDGGTQAFGMMAYGLQSGSNPDFYFALSTIVPVATAQFYSWEELTGADIAVSSTDATKIDAALGGKLDKSGGTMTGVLHIPYGLLSVEGGAGAQYTVSWLSAFDEWELAIKPEDSNTPYHVRIPKTDGRLALTAGIGHAGNLAALDANGNPTDSGLSKTNVVAFAYDVNSNRTAVTVGVPRQNDPNAEVDTSAVDEATGRFITVPTVVGPHSLAITGGEDEESDPSERTVASGEGAIAANKGVATNRFSVALGYHTFAAGEAAVSHGDETAALGRCSHSEGVSSFAHGDYSHTEGESTFAFGCAAHAEGYDNQAHGDYSHVEGGGSRARGDYAHAEGIGATAIGEAAHAEGVGTEATGYGSHAEGHYTAAAGKYSHAEGSQAAAEGLYSHAEGRQTLAQNDGEHAQGQFNASHKESVHFGNPSNTLSSVGFGLNDAGRRNAVETMQDGRTFVYGLGGYDGTNPANATDLASVINAKLSALVGQSMPETPTQNELAEAVKKIFVALGGTITNGTQNAEAERGLE